jgi:hypothetical protein
MYEILALLHTTIKHNNGGIKMAEIKFEITESIGVISESSKGWTKELNLVSWNNYAPKYDIREWDPEHLKMGKGVTFTKEELKRLRDLLNEMDLD